MLKRKSTETRNAVLPGDPTVDYPYALPYGFQPEQGVLVPDEKKAAIVTEIFRAAASGQKPPQIAETLNARKVPPPEEEQEWTAELIEAILRNPAYVGEWGGFGRLEEGIVEREAFESAQSVAAS
jgi:Recombinase